MEIKSTKDIPIEDVNSDKLGMKNHAKGLATFCNKCDTPMTIAIQGDWGSGKSSLMKLIEKEINTTSQKIQINAWELAQLGNESNIGLTFLYTMLMKLDEQSKSNGVSTENNKDSLAILKKTCKALGVGAAICVDSLVGNRAGDFIDRLVNNITKEENQIPSIAEVREALSSYIENLLKDNHKRLIIFIDDLDRLEPLKAVELLEVLKNFFDCKQCVFVLAVDYSVVVQGAKMKYGEFMDDEKASQYFDKIIQVPYLLPVVQWDVSKYLKSLGEEIAKFNGVSELCLELLNNNPRAIKRLVNVYTLNLSIAQQKDAQQKDAQQKDAQHNYKIALFAILALQIGNRKAYEELLCSEEIAIDQIITDNESIRIMFDFLDKNNIVKGEVVNVCRGIVTGIQSRKLGTRESNIDEFVEEKYIKENDKKIIETIIEKCHFFINRNYHYMVVEEQDNILRIYFTKKDGITVHSSSEIDGWIKGSTIKGFKCNEKFDDIEALNSKIEL